MSRSLFPAGPVLFCLSVTFAIHAADPALPAGPAFGGQEGQYLNVLRAGKPLLRYQYGFDSSTPETLNETYKPYAHVLAPDGKTLLTKGSGGQFPHHRGIFIGWNGITFDGRKYDLWHMKNTTMVHQKFLESGSDDRATHFRALIHWSTGEKKVLIEETRQFSVRHDDPGAHLTLDFTTQLKAVSGEVQLNMDPEHGGFQYRPPQEVAENKSATYTFPADKPDLKKETDLPWAAMTCKIAGEAWTVQHMNAPANPKGTRYSAYRDYGRFGTCFATTIPAGETLALRYRIRITPGAAPDRAALNKAYTDFSGK